MSDSSWYVAWVGYHAKATAAAPEAIVALIHNESIAIENWEACSEELHECTRRLVATCRTPKFPNEHVDAVGTELVILRKEKLRDGFMVPEVAPGTCPMACERGQIIAPLPAVVLARNTSGDLIGPCRLWTKQTMAVICDQCAAGKAESAGQERLAAMAAPNEDWKKRKRPTLSQYYTQTNGVDAIAIMRQMVAKEIAELRANRTDLDEYPNLAAMLAKTFRVPPKDKPRGPAALRDEAIPA